jgi:hypothetical protein
MLRKEDFFCRDSELGLKIRFWAKRLFVVTVIALKGRTKSVEDTKKTGTKISSAQRPG